MNSITDGLMFAWADGIDVGVANVEVLSHTWVTTYSPGAGTPDSAKGHYWYCRGVAHKSGEQIAQGHGGVEFACRIAHPNDPKADVGIRWGKDGFCHQMANRLLRFSADEEGNPVKVKRAKGYMLSVAAHGEYGGKRSEECRTRWENMVNSYLANGSN